MIYTFLKNQTNKPNTHTHTHTHTHKENKKRKNKKEQKISNKQPNLPSRRISKKNKQGLSRRKEIIKIREEINKMEI